MCCYDFEAEGPLAHEPGKLALRERLKRIDAWVRRQGVPVEHNNEAFYAVDSSGGRWVGKSTAISGRNQFLAEAVSYQLAALLKLPVPEGAFGAEGTELVWLSRCVPNMKHYSPAHHPLTAPLPDFGRILVFDVWVHNDDRHPGNILLEAGAGMFKPWFIDFGTALIGYPKDYLGHVDQVPREGQFAPRTVAPNLMREGVDAALAAISRLSDEDIRGVVTEACSISGFEADSDRLTEAVLRRRDSLAVLSRSFLVRLGIQP